MSDQSKIGNSTRLKEAYAAMRLTVDATPKRLILYHTLFSSFDVWMSIYNMAIDQLVFNEALNNINHGSGTALWCVMFLMINRVLADRFKAISTDEALDTEEEITTTTRQFGLLVRLLASCTRVKSGGLFVWGSWLAQPGPGLADGVVCDAIELRERQFKWPGQYRYFDAWIGLDAVLDQLRKSLPASLFVDYEDTASRAVVSYALVKSLREAYDRDIVAAHQNPSPLPSVLPLPNLQFADPTPAQTHQPSTKPVVEEAAFMSVDLSGARVTAEGYQSLHRFPGQHIGSRHDP